MSVKDEDNLGLRVGNVVAEQVHKLVSRLFETEERGTLQTVVGIDEVVAVDDHEISL